ncbi:MAG: Acetolactate decarboxylase [Verrucomicrobiales bacterium]|nr:Acetolactate decarboxylase [Verrucomicrobiales bacterium]
MNKRIHIQYVALNTDRIERSRKVSWAKKPYFKWGLLLLCIVCLSGCYTSRNTVTQFCTIDALMAGAYDGEMEVGNLTRHGDMGIGTFDKLDGEMVVLDRHVYQVKSDGKVYTPDATMTTPFAAVVNFSADQSFDLPAGMSYPEFEAFLDSKLPHTNVVCAFRFTGSFKAMKTRSVPAQTKPYRQLVEVSKTQPVFELNDRKGTLVGFRLPDFVKGINVVGYHTHFLTDDRKAGGHVLSFTMETGRLEIATSTRVELLLPKNASQLKDIDFSKDRSKEVEKVEK